MLARSMKNKDIQFFFNRPDRSVNTGRISTIGNGSYSNSAEVSPASDEELDSFIRSFASASGASKSNPQIRLADLVRSQFEMRGGEGWYLKGGENDECECKLIFDPKKLSPLVRAVAAMANNKGGNIFFGVSDGKYRLEGIEKAFGETDIVDIVEKIKTHLSPTPNIVAKEVVEIGGKQMGVIRVAKYPNPPVIVYRAGDGLNEGEILFRYPGQSSRIKFGDLRAMLEERDRRAQLALAGAARKLAQVGTHNALILDTDRNILDAQGHSILIDEKLIESIKFIKEGQFDEKAGAPTLKLIGEVSPAAVGAITKIKISREAIFQENILEEFLNQSIVEQPVQYIQAGLAQSRMWLPIFYYVKLAGLSPDKAADIIGGLKVAQKNKKKVLIERLLGQRAALTKAVTQPATKVAGDISKGLISVPTKVGDVPTFANGLTAVTKTKAPLTDLLTALRRCRLIAEKAEDGNAIGAVYKAACRVDEIFFS